jgi:23S rRNA (cytosine1962-C5)-methyltransferase
VKRSLPPSSAGDFGRRWIDGTLLAAFAKQNTTAHRIFSSPAAWIERFGPDLLLSYQDELARDQALAELQAWEETHDFSHRRIFGKFIPRQNDERAAPEQISGESAPLATVVEENGMQFGIDFEAGYSAGLFLDQRANRALLRTAPAKRLLNTFAYSCSFSVAAALGGAETVSVDLSRKSLDRGRANFELNRLDPKPHRFLADDVLEVLPRLARRGETFDAIILDPPTFSRGNKGRRFQVEQDFQDLVIAAMELAAERARILLSTNCLRLSRRALEAIGRFCLKATRRSGDFRAEPALPDIPAGHGAESLWLLLK